MMLRRRGLLLLLRWRGSVRAIGASAADVIILMLVLIRRLLLVMTVIVWTRGRAQHLLRLRQRLGLKMVGKAAVSAGNGARSSTTTTADPRLMPAVNITNSVLAIIAAAAAVGIVATAICIAAYRRRAKIVARRRQCWRLLIRLLPRCIASSPLQCFHRAIPADISAAATTTATEGDARWGTAAVR